MKPVFGSSNYHKFFNVSLTAKIVPVFPFVGNILEKYDKY